MSSLAEIRAKLQEMEANKTPSSNKSYSDNLTFPFWNIEEGDSATVRFLPDANPDNTFFWKEKQMIRLTFPGVKGQDENKPVFLQVPCVEMWGDTCPVHTELRQWFKDPNLEDLGRKYWKKRTYVFQAFVTQNPLNEEAPENPIRRMQIGPQVFNIIKAALMDPDMEELPTDYNAGVDFRISKGKKGQYADYSTSNWARRDRSLSEEELAAIETHGLVDLDTYLPKKPSDDAARAIFEMFEASVDGLLYDVEKWGQYYRPYGVEAPAGSTPSVDTTPKVETVTETVTPVVQETVAPVVQETVEVTETATTADGDKPSADDILAMIRNRQS